MCGGRTTRCRESEEEREGRREGVEKAQRHEEIEEEARWQPTTARVDSAGNEEARRAEEEAGWMDSEVARMGS